MQDVVRQSNELTRRWVGEAELGGGGVLSGAGVWPLLAALLSGASGPARDDLATAVGIPAEAGATAVADLVGLIRASASLRLAFGVWARPQVPLLGSWTEALPAVATGALPADVGEAQAMLDRWASEGTGGLIPAFPLEVGESTLFVLASALAIDARWEVPYDPSTVLWDGGNRWFDSLIARHGDLDLASVVEADGQRIGRFTSRTTDDLDVHLVAGAPDDAPATVLGLAIDALAGRATVQAGSSLELGTEAGCLSVQEIASRDPTPTLQVLVPAFDVQSHHDLLEHARLFGLATATADTEGHFDGISSYPLAVEGGAQRVVASFTAEGFRAAAVTAFAMRAGAALPSGRAHQLRFTFDRPFGFLAVQRSTGLVLVAGWVASPDHLHRSG